MIVKQARRHLTVYPSAFIIHERFESFYKWNIIEIHKFKCTVLGAIS